MQRNLIIIKSNKIFVHYNSKTKDKKSYLIHTMKLKDTSGNSDISNNIVKVATPKMSNKQYAEFLKAKPIKQWLADDLLRNLYVKTGNKNFEKYFNFDKQEAEKELEPVAEVLNKKRDNRTNLSM